MYNIAFIDEKKCVAEKGCRLCIMYCPESDCILIDKAKVKAVVINNRCKGCELCVQVCTTHHAITMYPVDGATGKIIMNQDKGESAGLGQAYSS